MLHAEKQDVRLIHIVCEPNDMTRYDFFVMEYHDDFLIMPCESTFKVPNRLNKWDIRSVAKKIKEEGLKYPEIGKFGNDLYKSHDVNPNTTVQIALAIYEVWKEVLS
jgi:hypothetical protein